MILTPFSQLEVSVASGTPAVKIMEVPTSQFSGG